MVQKCVFCKGGKNELFLETSDRLNPKEKYVYRRCLNCNLITLNERKDNKEFYIYNRYEKPSIAQLFSFWLFYKRLSRFKKKGKLLDFGCGAGNLAKYLSKKTYAVDCLDINAEAIKWVKNVHKLPITKKIQNKKYDIIILDNVFEHLPDPISEIKKIKQHLADNGILVMAIPNINSWQARIFREKWFHLDAPRHLNHFYKDSFNKIIKSEKLEIIKRFYFNINIDPIGWYWSIKKPKYNKNQEAARPSGFILGLFLPLVIISGLFRATGLVIYFIKNKGSEK